LNLLSEGKFGCKTILFSIVNGYLALNILKIKIIYLKENVSTPHENTQTAERVVPNPRSKFMDDYR